MIRKKIFDEDHADIATSYNNLASVHNSLGECNQPKKTVRRSTDDPQKDFQ